MLIEERNVESFNFSMKHVLSPGAHMTEYPGRKWMVDANPLVRERQVKIGRGRVAVCKVERAAGSQIEQGGMHKECGAV